MNFFEHQRQARRSTYLLIALFILAVLVISALIGGLVWYYNAHRASHALNLGEDVTALTWGVIWGVSTLVVIVLESLRRIWQLRQGGARVATEMGAVPILSDTRTPLLKRLYNVTEEVAIASRVPMPRLFWLENEAGLNAFAAGYTQNDAAVIVTRGLLERLNRDELQAVIAHEFSHIQNGDMRLNIRLIGLVHGILAISLLGKSYFASVFDLQYPWQRSKSARKEDEGNAAAAGFSLALIGAVLALLAISIGSIGVLFARLIKAAISRQREFLADASAVQFTRQKVGLAGALKKIGGLKQGSYLQNTAVAEEVSHMLFSQGLKLTDWFATHPPLLERICRLEPGFRPARLDKLRQDWTNNPPDGLAEDITLGFASVDTEVADKAESIGETKINPLAPIAAQKSEPLESDLLRQSLYQPANAVPEALRELAHHETNAPFLLLALLLDSIDTISRNQYDAIEAQWGTDNAFRVRELSRKALQSLPLSQRLPLAIMAFPALHRLDQKKRRAFSRCIEALSHADGHISLFSYCLSRLLQTQIHSLEQPRERLFGKRKLATVKEPLATLLAVIAWAGNLNNADTARRAWLLSWHQLFPTDNRSYQAPDNVLVLDTVWQPLDSLDAISKELLIAAMITCIRHNRILNVAEADLLHTVCGILHCPLPELLQTGYAHE